MLWRCAVAMVEEVVGDRLAGAVVQERGVRRRRPSADHQLGLAFCRPSLHPPRHRYQTTQNNMLLYQSQATLQTVTLPNHHNSISKEVRGAARAEITSEKPPKRSGSIGKLLCSMYYLRSTAFLQLTSLLTSLFQRHLH